MNFLSSYKFSAVAGILTILLYASCEKDLTTIGADVIGGEPFTTGQQSYDVFAFNRKINAVNTNRLPLYQLGTFNDPVYGKTEARIISQLQLVTTNPIFGNYSQSVEDNADNDGSVITIPENETLVSVFLQIPYLISDVSQRDRDNDGVDDEFEKTEEDLDNPNSDWDLDGVTDVREKAIGTDPFNPDTDNDGINDDEDTDTIKNTFPRKYDLDSIYGDRTIPFKVKVQRSTYFLRDLDPNANFEEAQEYFSDQQFTPTYVSEELNEGEGEVVISDLETIIFQDDDATTEEIDESTLVKDRFPPGIRIPLKKDFFQQNILDNEGGSELLSEANFRDFFRGVHLSLESSQDMMVLLDMKQATITLTYEYNSVDSDGVAPTTPAQKNFQLSFLRLQNGNTIGNAVNTFLNDEFPTEIAEKMDTGENASQIYLKGGAGSYAEIKLFNNDEAQAQGIIEQIKANNWIINEANLIFYVDRANLPEGTIEPPRLYLYNAETNGFLFDATTDPVGITPQTSFLQYDGLLQKQSDKGIKYTVRITKYLNDIILRDAENATLGITITPNINLVGAAKAMLADPNDIEKNIPVASTLSPLGTVLFGSGVSPLDQEKKLKLEIYYTKAN